jgi:hypothetical protein
MGLTENCFHLGALTVNGGPITRYAGKPRKRDYKTYSAPRSGCVLELHLCQLRAYGVRPLAALAFGRATTGVLLASEAIAETIPVRRK